jgi:hypothetical protein
MSVELRTLVLQASKNVPRDLRPDGSPVLGLPVVVLALVACGGDSNASGSDTAASWAEDQTHRDVEACEEIGEESEGSRMYTCEYGESGLCTVSIYTLDGHIEGWCREF